MAVYLLHEQARQNYEGKFAKVGKDQVFLYSGIMQDKKAVGAAAVNERSFLRSLSR